MLEFLSIEIIPASVIHPLPEKLDGRLCAKLFFLRHVQVIDKNDNLVFSLFGPEKSFSSSCAYFRVNESLYLISDSLSRKGSCYEGVFLIVIIEIKLISYVDWFASTSWSTEQHVHVILYIKVQEVIVTNGVICRNDQLIVCDVLWNHESGDCLRPVLPHHFLHVVKHVENIYFLWQLCRITHRMKFIVWVELVLIHDIWTAVDQVDKERIECLSGSLFKGNSYRPDGTEHNEVWNYVFNFLRDFSLFANIYF